MSSARLVNAIFANRVYEILKGLSTATNPEIVLSGWGAQVIFVNHLHDLFFEYKLQRSRKDSLYNQRGLIFSWLSWYSKFTNSLFC